MILTDIYQPHNATKRQTAQFLHRHDTHETQPHPRSPSATATVPLPSPVIQTAEPSMTPQVRGRAFARWAVMIRRDVERIRFAALMGAAVRGMGAVLE